MRVSTSTEDIEQGKLGYKDTDKIFMKFHAQAFHRFGIQEIFDSVVNIFALPRKIHQKYLIITTNDKRICFFNA
jgi:hypothetical protein